MPQTEIEDKLHSAYDIMRAEEILLLAEINRLTEKLNTLREKQNRLSETTSKMKNYLKQVCHAYVPE